MRLGLKVLTGSLGMAGAVALVPIATGVADQAPTPAAIPVAKTIPKPPERAERDTRPVSQSEPIVAIPAAVRPAVDSSITSHPTLKALLAGTSYEITRYGPWTRMRSKEQVGSVVEIRLSKATDTPMQLWPVATWDESADSYGVDQLNASYRGVQDLVIQLDTDLQIVSIAPKNPQSITLGSGNQWIQKYVGTGGGDR